MPAEPRLDPIASLRPRRPITGMAAVYLPHTRDGAIDWTGFESLVERTAAAGLTPAVGMDTGFVDLLTDAQVVEVLGRTRAVLGGGGFVAGAFVADRPGAAFEPGRHEAAMARVQEHGGVPVVFPNHGLAAVPDGELPDAFARLAGAVDRFIGFELGPMFVPFGRIFPLDVYAALLDIPQCIGAKHSSLSREAEWQRLALRDATRPGFHVFTGNDLAIDMVMYGSDYLLGLAACAPDLFAERDRWWADGDVRFYERNDALQALGAFAFRAPVPGYKHDVGMFLELRGWIGCSDPPVGAARRPVGDRAVLARLAERLGVR